MKFQGSTMKSKNSLVLLGVAGLLSFSGCSRLPSIPNPVDLVAGPSTLHVDVPVKPGAIPMQRAGRSLSLAVADFADGRAGKPGRKVGDIKTTVINMHATEMVLDQDIPALLSTAARAQLAADGFRLEGAGAAVDFALSGVVKSFSLNIAGRDERLIAVDATLREGAAGDIVWAGVITAKDDRYAGVSGNSRGSIVEYLGEGVSDFSAKLSAVVRENLARSYPKTIAVNQSPTASDIPGVTTLHTPVVREKTAAAETPKAVALPMAVAAPAPAPAPAPVAAANVGYLSIYSSPSRAKVYVDDVYFGMAPLKVELPAGVSLLRFKLDGYKAVTEKVSVRLGVYFPVNCARGASWKA
ncbi:MAG: PEGA domain-containing protein [Rhodocyclales bacterium]|nr:PEGA domain-containing protein [Rhodocyclales bacterium]